MVEKCIVGSYLALELHIGTQQWLLQVPLSVLLELAIVVTWRSDSWNASYAYNWEGPIGHQSYYVLIHSNNHVVLYHLYETRIPNFLSEMSSTVHHTLLISWSKYGILRLHNILQDFE